MSGAGYSSSWFTQIGLTAAIETQAHGGAGITIALIDTGVADTNPEIAGRVSPLSSCAAVTFACSSGYADDEGHGTATAAIAAGAYNNQDLMSGVAPSATVLSEKVLDASGSGYDTDVANGILKAADAGAPVISLSLTYIPTPDIVAAINYATGKGAVIVWAGGNASSPLNGGADTTGLTANALSHLIIVGSVDSANHLSWFSNTPGTASAVSNAASRTYASLWLMAPGENIWAPAIQYGGNGVFSTWTGTSMSTPEVAGAVALLEATWPILRTNGTTAAVLFASATDLGATGVDGTNGNGLLNISRAFQPVGQMSLLGVGGQSTGVGGTGTVTASGALGSMPALRAQLSHYTAFDAFERNFTLNLSGMVSAVTTSPNAQPALAPPTTTHVSAITGGRMMLVSAAPQSFAAGVWGEGDGAYAFDDRMQGHRDRSVAYVEFAGTKGGYMAMGQGVPSALSFARAAWGADSPAADQTASLGVTTALADLAQGGRSMAAGASVFGRLRVAASWTSSPPPTGSAFASDRARADASAFSAAATLRLTPRWSVGATMGSLAEDNALLGTVYSGYGPISLGARHRSRQVGFSTAFDLGGRRSVLAEWTLAQADRATLTSGLISNVTPLKARAFGVSFLQGDAFADGDQLSVSLRKPLRVTSGQASLAITTVDDQGEPHTTFAPISLTPSGNETDLTVGYAAPVRGGASFRSSLSLRQDADNQAGRTDVALRFGMNLAF